MHYKFIQFNNYDPYRNLAFERSLFKLVEPEMAILFLWQNDNTIVIGRNQDINKECRADEFVKSGGKIARRCSGGGAVYHDLGNLNFSIISRVEDKEKCLYSKLIKSCMNRLHIPAIYNGRNDLLAEGCKISGNAFYDNGEIYCQHGTLLINTDIEKMSYYLTPDLSKLERNHVSSVKSRVINISEINRTITVKSMVSAIIKTAQAAPITADIDKEAYNRYLRFFTDDNWIRGIVHEHIDTFRL